MYTRAESLHVRVTTSLQILPHITNFPTNVHFPDFINKTKCLHQYFHGSPMIWSPHILDKMLTCAGSTHIFILQYNVQLLSRT